MEKELEQLKEAVVRAAANPAFIHHQWFAQYHLEVVLRLSLEFAQNYPEANLNIVRALVWLHDYSKILDFDRQHDMDMLEESRKLLTELGFEKEFADKVIELLQIFESKMEVDLHTAPIEVRIVSSADAASHLVGPFYFLYWYENAGKKGFEEIMADNRKKAIKDWERKMVLPEVKERFAARHTFLLEMVNDTNFADQ